MFGSCFDCFLYSDKSCDEIEEILNTFKVPLKWAYIKCDKREYKPYYHIYLNFGKWNVNTKYLIDHVGFEEEDIKIVSEYKYVTQFLNSDPNVVCYFNVCGKMLYTYKDVKKNF